MAAKILAQFQTHQPLIDAGVSVDFVFAYGNRDEAGNLIGDAIKHRGAKALGLCRKIALKDRALGRADAEITLDGDWWPTAPEPQQRALLDHELHHLAIKIDKRGLVRDDLGRPVIQLRQHDVEVGWFMVIAARHQLDSQERIQARQIMADAGQYFWPEIAGELPPPEESPVTLPPVARGFTSITIGPKEAEMLKRAATALRADGQPTGTPTSDTDEDEELIQQCIEVIRSEQKASVSLLQRRLRLGYTRAALIMDEIEKRGLIGPSNGAEPREIKMDLNTK